MAAKGGILMKPMLDLKKQYLGIKDEILSMINDVLESSQYVLGRKGAELEEKVRSYHGMNEAIGVASGTDALHLSLRALGIGPGDEVITTPFTFLLPQNRYYTSERVLSLPILNPTRSTSTPCQSKN
jgi:dTDP-4-amino-4,6-dideoxygalactose transaminase